MGQQNFKNYQIKSGKLTKFPQDSVVSKFGKKKMKIEIKR